MIRILFVFHDADYYSGATRSLCDIIDNLVKISEIDIWCLLPKTGSAKEHLDKAGATVLVKEYYQIKYFMDEGIFRHIVRFPFRSIEFAKSVIVGKKLVPLLRKSCIDIIYSNTSVLINGMLFRKYLPNARHIWHIREFCEEDHRIGIFIGRKLYYYLLNRYTDHVIYISEALKKKYKNYIYGPESDVIYNDISPEYFIPITRSYSAGEEMNILMAGMLCKGKGQMQVLEAVNDAIQCGCNIKLYFAGRETDKDYVQRLKKYVRDNGIGSNVKFLGLVKDMNSVRKKMQFGIVGSSAEAFGRVTVEGMLGGLCMIGADEAGTSELIQDGRTGRLYQYGDIKGLSGVLQNLFENKDDCVNRLRTNGQRSAQQFAVGNCASRVLEIVRKEVNRRE